MNGVALLVGSTISLFGQQGATPLSLPDAIQLAYAHSNAVQIAQSSLDGAKSRLGQQSSRSVPHLGINGSATRFDDKTAVNLPGLGSFEVLPDHQEQLGVELAQDLDVAGQIGAGIAQARLLVLSAKYTVDAVKQDQALTTTTTFYSALRAKQAVAVA
jgi:outer membrane protein TolC